MLHSRRSAFTLVEILVVVGIIGLLAAILFPVFNMVRRRSYGATCISNLKQLGVAVNLYTQDYDGLFPRGGDPTDLNTPLWHEAADGVYEQQVNELAPLTFVVRPYLKGAKVWRCPADTGFDVDDLSDQILDARPTMFDKFGMSYVYRTKLTLENKKDLRGWDRAGVEHGASDINVLSDAHGAWHGEDEPWRLRRYNVLMADGRAVNLTHKQYLDTWHLNLDHPPTTPVTP